VTHILILQGTPTGAPLPALLRPVRVANAQQFGGARVDYRLPNELHPARVTNAQRFGAPTVRNVIVRELIHTCVVNANAVAGPTLAALPFDPVNDETDALLAAFTGSYATTAKRQIDRLITELKSAGVWSKLDWYGNAFWATTEHDALLNWINPARTLTRVGGASWVAGQGLKGVSPMTDPGRYKSGWNVGDGPHSSATSFAMFCKATAIDVPHDNMQPMGLFELSTPGPSAPNGSFLILSITSNSGSAGANVLPFNGNAGFAVGDGRGVWGVARAGGNNITVKNGVTLKSDAVSGSSSYTNADGICIAGSGPGFGAQQSFPGLQLYWGWGAALTAAELGRIESAFVNSQLPAGLDTITGALLIDDASNYLVDEDGNYIVVAP
jgi:hypothetical protein